MHGDKDHLGPPYFTVPFFRKEKRDLIHLSFNLSLFLILLDVVWLQENLSKVIINISTYVNGQLGTCLLYVFIIVISLKLKWEWK